MISSLTICQDEQSYIKHMLDYLIEVVKPDEIVIVDGGSTDDTLWIINSYIQMGANIKLIENPMPDSFSEQRNLALENCTGKWILHIDADETYSNSLCHLTDKIKDDKFNDITGFMFPTAHLIVNNMTMLAKTGPDYHIRLFKNIDELKYFGCVHEQPSIGDKPLTMGVDGYRTIHRNDIALKHYSLLKGNTDLLAKGKRYVKWIQHSIDAGIPLTDENHFVNCVNSVTDSDIKAVPAGWL